MSWSKRAVVAYHFIDSASDDYFKELKLSFDSLLDSHDSSGVFDAGQSHYFWKIEDRVDVTDTNTYFVSLVKEKNAWPVYFNEDEGISAIPIDNGALGELYYAFINPELRFMLSLAASGGGPVGAFKKFLHEFSKDGSVKLSPMFEDKIDVKTLSWDLYKKLSFSINFPNQDIQSEFMTTHEGSLLGIISELNGLKADITISMPKQNQKLGNAQVKELVKSLLIYDYCGRIVLRGADAEGESVQEYDLKNAQVKYRELVEISGSYMSIDEAILILKRAYNDRSYDLTHLVESENDI